MPKRSTQPKRKRGRPRTLGLTSTASAQTSSPSLPPVTATDEALAPTTDTGEKPWWYMPPDSDVRVKALKIQAMRMQGIDDDAIARALDISPKSISPYLYRAGRNGWLAEDDPKNRLEYQVLHKVVRNLDEGLDSTATLQTGMPVKTAVALKVAEGTLFQKANVGGPTVVQTAISIKIEGAPAGAAATFDTSDLGGTPAFVEGEEGK